MGNAEPGSALTGTTKTVDATSLTGVYSNGPLFASLSYQDADSAGSEAWKAGIGYTFGDTKVGFVYEDVENDAVTGHPVGANGERDSWLLNVVHAMGHIVLKAQYGQADVNALDQDAWMLGGDYILSKRTTLYFVYGSGDNDAGKDASGWNLGVKHNF
jgi:predicted porin